MLIRWATIDDRAAWIKLAGDVSSIFRSETMPTDESFLTYVDSKLSKFEALIAVDRTTDDCLGIIGFSRTNNRISWFGVFEQHRNKGIGTKLLSTALRQLDNKRIITVDTFCDDYPLGQPARVVYQKFGFVEMNSTLFDEHGNPCCRMALEPTIEKRGHSFHYNYLEYKRLESADNCPCCKNDSMPSGDIDIAELEYSFITAERKAQGRLFGKCHVMLKKHYNNFEDIPLDEMTGFMNEVQIAGKALRKVTGAIKINYEIHANSLPHIHCHLFPRYLDDDFPSGPIDFRIHEPSPYKNDAEFNWFVEQMRLELESR